ncbi:carbohydrate-binding protein [Actinoplanes sp. LDG1-06]|uniref:Carbohydrate-binding protein n=1 Tax=Paractinoplanes ovalisporus TaxID=2810368 RepID=A0ABS2AQB4_9ACTN|nr:carbohydrate-binding protein [Actinoplanes ovalisporus]MBM2621933.1 carbohydrate-binding protein [Actinoplanes ovalisporus]
MVAPPPSRPNVYRTRAYRVRQRSLLALAGLGLLLAGYGIGRWQESPAPAAALPPVASAPPAPSETPSAVPPTSEPPTPTVYPKLEPEAADGNIGIQSQATEDEGGGQNVGWIANGDQLRFDDVDFGPVAATKLDVRVAGDAEGGRMEIRLDGADQAPIGTLNVTRTGGWQNWRTDQVDITPTTGKHTVFLTFAREDGNEFLNLNWLQFVH